MAVHLGEYPDRVQGTPYVEQVEEKYKLKVAIGICNALREADPETLSSLGGFEECVRAASRWADYNFDMWKINWPKKVGAAIAAFK